MTGDELIQQFEDGTTPAATFHHADHVRLAFVYLSRYPALEALEKFSAALKRFAAAQGKPTRYHETITWAYLLLIRERMARSGCAQTWEEFAGHNPDLLIWKGGVLASLYRQETLDSDLARHTFVLPDQPLSPETCDLRPASLKPDRFGVSIPIQSYRDFFEVLCRKITFPPLSSLP